MSILIQFLYRLSFGLALGMAATSPRWVTSGYFRVHLYVVLGLNTLAALAGLSSGQFAAWPALAGAALSYAGAVAWLYELPRAGRLLLTLVAATALAGAFGATTVPTEAPAGAAVLRWVAPPTSGLVLGWTMAAMLLGHWYLNTPSMQLEPLRRLLIGMGVALGVRMMVSAAGLLGEGTALFDLSTLSLSLLAIRWLFGLIGAAVLTTMAWQTLKIPNTQSATGILYVAVIATLLGELTSQLLSAETVYPL